MKEIFSLYEQGINASQIEHYLFLEDPKTQEMFCDRLGLDSIESQLKFSQIDSGEILNIHLDRFSKEAESKRKLNLGVRPGKTYSDYEKFDIEIQKLIADIITTIFNERIELTTHLLEDILSFYDRLLQQQQQYRKESEEMRQAEKEWIDTQYDRLQESEQELSQTIELCNSLLSQETQ
ncbi:MAG: hypothetical protein J7641_02915 [Cyanobacteria bacterium SID2]|nr:hypothetical protein [Cyanobacteria bacterium SID2]